MSIRKVFTPNYIVLSIILALAVIYQLHWIKDGLGVTASEEIAIVILIATAVLWVSEALPLYITSLGVLFVQIVWLLPVLKESGIEAHRDDFLISFFGDITLLFMGGFVLAAMLNKYRISRIMARSILKRTGDKPDRILLSIILVSSLLSMWMSNTATAAMMFAIMSPIVLSLPDTSKFSKAIALAIPFACNLGGLGTPIGTPPNAIALEYLKQVGLDVSFARWMLLAVPLMLILLFLLWKLLLKLYPPGDLEIEVEIEKLHTLRKRQYLVIGIFILTIIGWLTTGYSGLTTGTVGLFVVLAAFGSNLLDTQDFKNISWDILFMLGGGLCLGVGLKLSGLTNSIASLIPIENSFFIVLLFLVVVSAVMTTFMSNTATANLLIPVAVALPHGEFILVVAISLMCSSSMVLPISTPPNAIAFGSGFLESRELSSSGLMVTIIALIGIMLTSIFYLPMIV